MFAKTPDPPYYAVIFTSVKSSDDSGYPEMAEMMVKMAEQAEGFLGMESARDKIGITVSYWDSPEAIRKWKMNTEHRAAQEMGKQRFYDAFKVRICKVERDYGFFRSA